MTSLWTFVILECPTDQTFHGTNKKIIWIHETWSDLTCWVNVRVCVVSMFAVIQLSTFVLQEEAVSYYTKREAKLKEEYRKEKEKVHTKPLGMAFVTFQNEAMTAM